MTKLGPRIDGHAVLSNHGKVVWVPVSVFRLLEVIREVVCEECKAEIMTQDCWEMISWPSRHTRAGVKSLFQRTKSAT